MEIRKEPKTDFNGTDFDHREFDAHCKEYDLEDEELYTTALENSE